MSCTTILVGKKASYDGSTMVARNDDDSAGHFTVKNFTVIHPSEMPKVYKSVISHLEVPLPDSPLRFTATPNVLFDKGIWAGNGVNSANVAMTATETITTNPRVLAADPFAEYRPACGGQPEMPGGIGEEDIVYLVLPFIHSAREGVKRLGKLLEEYGTYEPNGIAFQDRDEIWWFETIGGHHWLARRVPDDVYAVMPNQLGLDCFDFDDALSEEKNYMCSPDMRSFISENHLDLSLNSDFNPRAAFGTRDDSDHIYNTPRAWFMLRFFNPHTMGNDTPDCSPVSDFLPWCMVPERKITPEDIKYVLSSHYQGTPFDPYAVKGDDTLRGVYRPIGINRNSVLALMQLRNKLPEDFCAVEWIAFSSNTFNAMAPFYANIETIPDYLSGTEKDISTDSFYWCSRLLGAMADAAYSKSVADIWRYQQAVAAAGSGIINHYDRLLHEEPALDKRAKLRELANAETAAMLREKTTAILQKVLFSLSNGMKNSFSLSDN